MNESNTNILSFDVIMLFVWINHDSRLDETHCSQIQLNENLSSYFTRTIYYRWRKKNSRWIWNHIAWNKIQISICIKIELRSLRLWNINFFKTVLWNNDNGIISWHVILVIYIYNFMNTLLIPQNVCFRQTWELSFLHACNKWNNEFLAGLCYGF